MNILQIQSWDSTFSFRSKFTALNHSTKEKCSIAAGFHLLHFPLDESYVRVREFKHTHTHMYMNQADETDEIFLSAKDNNAYLIEEIRKNADSILGQHLSLRRKFSALEKFHWMANNRLSKILCTPLALTVSAKSYVRH